MASTGGGPTMTHTHPEYPVTQEAAQKSFHDKVYNEEFPHIFSPGVRNIVTTEKVLKENPKPETEGFAVRAVLASTKCFMEICKTVAGHTERNKCSFEFFANLRNLIRPENKNSVES
ncbi:hypothetical protein J6590_034098 [Homalodisca vitripennis]|nr:hypothetical protein J6590_034098 [Homalodisca vitripennis]